MGASSAPVKASGPERGAQRMSPGSQEIFLQQSWQGAFFEAGLRQLSQTSLQHEHSSSRGGEHSQSARKKSCEHPQKPSTGCWKARIKAIKARNPEADSLRIKSLRE
ncbi:MAG: hypothetical protein ACJAQT_004443 [Akkermansiaceae bacterium]|jgi:hypothetical protein